MSWIRLLINQSQSRWSIDYTLINRLYRLCYLPTIIITDIVNKHSVRIWSINIIQSLVVLWCASVMCVFKVWKMNKDQNPLTKTHILVRYLLIYLLQTAGCYLTRFICNKMRKAICLSFHHGVVKLRAYFWWLKQYSEAEQLTHQTNLSLLEKEHRPINLTNTDHLCFNITLFSISAF